MSSKLIRGDPGDAKPISWQHGSSANIVADCSVPLFSIPEPAGSQAAQVPHADELAAAARRQGFEEGQAAARQGVAAQMEAIQIKMARTIDELSGARLRYRREAEQDVVALALAVSRRILHRELTVSPEALAGVVKAALEKMEAREIHRARVAREDAAAIKKMFDQFGVPQNVEIVPDAAVARGGLIIESSRGELDASVDTQLNEIERGFADLVRSSG